MPQWIVFLPHSSRVPYFDPELGLLYLWSFVSANESCLQVVIKIKQKSDYNELAHGIKACVKLCY